MGNRRLFAEDNELVSIGKRISLGNMEANTLSSARPISHRGDRVFPSFGLIAETHRLHADIKPLAGF
jgi:hypothetical protein